MENIDDLMRQKFDSDDPAERFEFREEYWEQAKALLEKDEARRRRRQWLFAGLAVAIGLCAWLWAEQDRRGDLSQNTQEQGSTEQIERQPPNPDSFGRKLSGSSNTPRSTEERKITNAGTLDANGYRQDDKGKTAGSGIEKTPGEERSTQLPKSFLPKKSGSRNPNTPRSAEERKIINAGTLDADGFRQGDKGKAAGSGIEKTPGEERSTQLPDPDFFGRKPSGSSNTPRDAGERKTTNAGALDADGFRQNDKDTAAVSSPPAAPTNQPTNQPLSQSASQPIFNLPTPLTPIPLSERVIAPRKVIAVPSEPIANKIEPDGSKRFLMGLSIAGSAYQPDTLSHWAGWSAGVYGDYLLSQNLSLCLGVNWRFLPGHDAPSIDSANPNVVQQLRYSFGFRREEWRRETQGLHYLEVPISARWRTGRFGVEGGGAAGWLLGVQSRVTHTTESSLEGKVTEVRKFVKGNASPYNQVYFSAFAGAEYRLSHRFSLTARAGYRFTPIAKNLPDVPKNKGLGNVDLGLRVRLF